MAHRRDCANYKPSNFTHPSRIGPIHRQTKYPFNFSEINSVAAGSNNQNGLIHGTKNNAFRDLRNGTANSCRGISRRVRAGREASDRIRMPRFF